MLSSPHDSPFILVLCVSKIFEKSRRGHPLRGRQTEVGYDKTGDISETRRVDQSIDTTCYQLSATVDCDQHTRDRGPVSTVNSHFQSNEHWKVEYEHPFSRASAAQQLKACPWRTNRKSYMVYRTAPFSMTLKDPIPRFQGQAILWRWISPKWLQIRP